MKWLLLALCILACEPTAAPARADVSLSAEPTSKSIKITPAPRPATSLDLTTVTSPSLSADPADVAQITDLSGAGDLLFATGWVDRLHESRLFRSEDGGMSWGIIDVPRPVVTGRVVFPGDRLGLRSTFADGRLVVSEYVAGSPDSQPGGLLYSDDRGKTFAHARGINEKSDDMIRHATAKLAAIAGMDGRTIFLAESPWYSTGAATGPSQILASRDGVTWRWIGEIPGPATFGPSRQGPLLSQGKNFLTGTYRLDGADLEKYAITQIGHQNIAPSFLDGRTGQLWGANAWNSSDDGVTWEQKRSGLDTTVEIRGFLLQHDRIFGLGTGVWVWDGTAWSPARSALKDPLVGVASSGRWYFAWSFPDDRLWRVDP